MVPSHYLNKCWNSVNWALRNKLQWKVNQNSNIFIEKNMFENAISKMLAILSRPQCVKQAANISKVTYKTAFQCIFKHFYAYVSIRAGLCNDIVLETRKHTINTLRLRQNGCRFPDDIFKWIFFNEIILISIKISLKFVPRGRINNIPALVQIMAWRRPGDKPLSEPMMVSLPTHICVTPPLWVNICI